MAKLVLQLANFIKRSNFKFFFQNNILRFHTWLKKSKKFFGRVLYLYHFGAIQFKICRIIVY